MLGKSSNWEKKANMSAAFKTMMPSSVLLTWIIAILPASNFIITNGGILNKSCLHCLNDGLCSASNGLISQ